ncbi:MULTISPECIES: glycosyltransferase [unclassified Staphylococcus]|uniref:glycosyltransferase n=1 Tax=unclassified Staphylococcus TaxID=91994 RepID=UPI001EF446B6|nr:MULTISPECIES: glycosyltransferase [unclassified Staphylococcus]
MKHVYLTIFDIDIEKGGKTSALLTRAKKFNEQQLNTDIITFDYKTDYDKIMNKLIDLGKIDKNTKLYNQFHHFEKKSLNNKSDKININKKYMEIIGNSINIKTDDKNTELYSKFTGKKLGVLKSKDDDFTLDIIENDHKVERVYCVNNWIRRIKHYDIEGDFAYEVFFNRNGQPFLRRDINKKNGKLKDIYLLSESKHFKNNIELGKYFISDLITDDKDNIIICDGPGSVDKIINSTIPHVQKYAVMHTTHTLPNGEIKLKEEKVLKNSNKLDGIVFLTNEYIKDVKDKYNITNAYQINNFVNDIPEISKNQPNKIIGCISRLSKNKGFDIFIKVAEQVIALEPNAEFHIYGEGDYKSSLHKLIHDKNLETKIKLFNYTNNPYQTLESFKCVLSTSQSEVQSLSMIEAMLKGKPVVAFDIKYGPSEFIENDVNGYLIPNKNEEKMVEAILEIINDDEKAVRLGTNARESVLSKFNPQNIVNNWLELFNEK